MTGYTGVPHASLSDMQQDLQSWLKIASIDLHCMVVFPQAQKAGIFQHASMR
jgi:hypothetical protein